MTLAATLATAPLAAHHFGTVSLTAIPANLVALPAIAPAMWLGMLAGALGQLPGAPVEPLTALGGLCAGYIGWVAHVLRRRSGRSSRCPSRGWPRRSRSRSPSSRAPASPASRPRAVRALRPAWRLSRRRLALAAALAVALAFAVATLGGRGSRLGRGLRPPPALVIRVLDVGQGDAILLEPRRAPPVLVDAGPPGGGGGGAAAPSSGSSGSAPSRSPTTSSTMRAALGEVLAQTRGGRLVVSEEGLPAYCRGRVVPAGTRRRPGPDDPSRTAASRRPLAAGLRPAPPPRRRPERPLAGPPGALGEFEALLTGDAEAELAPVDPGPVDVLKVAHHGSAGRRPRSARRSAVPAARRDLGRSGQPVRPSGARDARHARPTRASRSCAPTRRARSSSRSAGTAGASSRVPPPMD